MKDNYQDLTLYHHIEVWKQSALEAFEEPKPESDPFELFEPGIKMCEEADRTSSEE
jgi:hypothetical protein